MGDINHQSIWVVYDIALPAFSLSNGYGSKLFKIGVHSGKHSDGKSPSLIAKTTNKMGHFPDRKLLT